MLESSYPYYLANRPQAPNQDLEVHDKFRGEVATRVAEFACQVAQRCTRSCSAP